MIETSIDQILKQAKKKKKISAISTNPLGRIDQINKLMKKDSNFIEVIEIYNMFKKINELRKERTGEFRKNVTLKIFYQGKEIDINLDKLKEYSEKIEKFINATKQFLKD